MSINSMISDGQDRLLEMHDALAARKGKPYANVVARTSRMTSTLGALGVALPRDAGIAMLADLLLKDILVTGSTAAGIPEDGENTPGRVREFVEEVTMFTSTAQKLGEQLGAALSKGQ